MNNTKMPPSQAFKLKKPAFHKKKELNFQERIPESTLIYYPHYLFPGMNLNKRPWIEKWDLGNIKDSYQEYPYRSDLPKPLLPPSKDTQCLLMMSDPATDLLFTKQHIKDDTERILDNYQKHPADHTFVSKKDLQWTTDGNKKETTLPRYLADLSDIIEMDPDPLFQGKYNWYYTGGSLTGFTFNNRFILVFPYMNELVAMPLKAGDNFTWKPMYKNASKYAFSNRIYDIRCKTSPTCQILVRLKNECTILTLFDNDGKLQLIPFDVKSSNTPIISADIAPDDCKQYCTLNANHTMEVYDIMSGKVITKGDIKLTQKLDDNWGSVKFNPSNPDLITYTNRCCSYYFDSRVEMTGPVLSMCPKSNLEVCESISLQLFSTRPSRLYFGTYHSVLLCDDRNPTECVFQKWTHQLKSTPYQGCVSEYEDGEMVLMSSQLCTDKTVIINSWRETPHSYYLPQIPPSMLDTLKTCQRLGKCLDPLLTPRFNLSTAGIHLQVTEDNNAFLFSQNSIGDVFYQCLTHNKNSEKLPFYNSQAQYALDCWERQILRQGNPLPPFVMCDRVNMEDAFNTFINKEFKYTVKPNNEESYVPEYWKQPLEKLKTYVDLLAPELLAAWEMPDEHEPEPSTNQHDKVLNWLEMADEKEIPESQQLFDDEEPFPFTPMESQELVSVSQQHTEFKTVPVKNPDEPEAELMPGNAPSEFDFEDILLPAVKVRTKKKTGQKKSGFVDGFQ